MDTSNESMATINRRLRELEQEIKEADSNDVKCLLEEEQDLLDKKYELILQWEKEMENI